jgi:hypothetical protein
MDAALKVCLEAMSWTERQGYAGYGKFDALNSPLLHKIAGNSRILRSAFIYVISRSPINVRPLLGVQKRQNPKALGILARTCFNLHLLTDDERWLGKGLQLLDRLLELSQIATFSGHCWGADHPRANPQLGKEAHFPGAVITSEISQAFLDAFETTTDKKFLDIANSAAGFIRRDLGVLVEGDDELCLGYAPNYTLRVINSNAKTASLLARIAEITNDDGLRQMARANMSWVIARQTEYGAWFYVDPPTASHVKHDNYHTAFVLNSLCEYMMSSGDRTWKREYEAGLEFYERNLFLSNGAPKWRHNRTYPLDIKGAAQGILAFSLAAGFFPGKEMVAERIANWAISTMWRPEGRFYYQKGRLWKKRFTLIRWCQAWTCYALSQLAMVERRLSGAAGTANVADC